MTIITNNGVQYEPTVKRISFNAIFAGIVVSFAIMTLLNLLGLGIGSILLDPTTEGSLHLGAGTIMWIIITGFLSLFAGGWVAGRLSPTILSFETALHGIMVWGIFMFLNFIFIASSISVLVGGASSMIGSSLSAIGKGAVTVGSETIHLAPKAVETAKNLFPDQMAIVTQIQDQAKELLDTAQNKLNEAQESVQNDQSTKKLQKKLGALVTAYFSEESLSNEEAMSKAKEALVEFLVKNTNVSEEKANKTVEQWQAEYKRLKEKASQKIDEAQQKVEKVANDATTVAGKIFLSVFFLVLLQGIAGAVGGIAGGRSKKQSY
jgi:hypothetical protein